MFACFCSPFHQRRPASNYFCWAGKPAVVPQTASQRSRSLEKEDFFASLDAPSSINAQRGSIQTVVDVTHEILAQVSNAATIAIGGLGVFVALRNQHRQLNSQMFIEFSGRFQELLRLFPTDAWLANRNPCQPMPPPSQELTDCTLYAMQFIADVYRLHKSGYLSKSLWSLWELEIRRTLAGPVFQREWHGVAAEFAHSLDFVEYINTVTRAQRGRASNVAASGAGNSVPASADSAPQ
jgi:hypothetical protein